MRRARLPLLLPALCLTLACQSVDLPDWARSGAALPGTLEIDSEIYRRAEAERSEFYEREVERLRADLREAEESIVALESGLRDRRTRAEAVSAVAEVRVALDPLRRQVRWRADRLAEADSKLEVAEQQLEAGNLGAALFFASRAQRIADSLRAEARQVALWSERRTIRADLVNMRTGPSLDYDVIRTLPRSTPVFRERLLAGWALVRTPDGRVGWVRADLIAPGGKTSPANAAP